MLIILTVVVFWNAFNWLHFKITLIFPHNLSTLCLLHSSLIQSDTIRQISFVLGSNCNSLKFNSNKSKENLAYEMFWYKKKKQQQQ